MRLATAGTVAGLVFGVLVSVLLVLATGIAVERARGQPKARMWADLLLDVSTEEIPRRVRVRANLDHWEPGAETGRHRHPVPPCS